MLEFGTGGGDNQGRPPHARGDDFNSPVSSEQPSEQLISSAAECLQAGRFAEARTLIADLLSRDDGDSRAIYLDGVLALSERRYPEAAERPRTAVSLHTAITWASRSTT